MKNRRFSTVDLCFVGVMSAIAIVLSFTLKIPMAFFAPWLSLDLSYVPMMLTGFALGPVAGLFVLLITNILQLLGVSTAVQYIVQGAVLLLAINLDHLKKR